MEFWKDERCEYCGGRIVEKRVDLPRKVAGRYVLIEKVPTGICTKCGSRYYTANVLKTMEETIRRRQKAVREIVMPVYSL
jgi:YgiT-type zinc finger domain-containing protein